MCVCRRPYIKKEKACEKNSVCGIKNIFIACSANHDRQIVGGEKGKKGVKN